MRRSLLLAFVLVLVVAGCTPAVGADAPALEAESSMPSTAVASIPGSTGTSAFVAEWATGSVLRVALTPLSDGSTWTGIPEPFLAGIARPVGIAVAPDGSIVVGDWETGTIYRVVPG